MDLRLLIRVMRRFWYLTVPGALIALALGVLSVARVQGGFPPLAYRDPSTYQSSQLMLLSQPSGPWERAMLPMITPPGGGTPVPASDPARLAGLTPLYTYFMQSDEVRRLSGGESASVVAENVQTKEGSKSVNLPLLKVTATATDPATAARIANRVGAAFRTYLRAREARARVPQADRVRVEVLNEAAAAERVSGPSPTRGVVIFMGVMLAVVAMALVMHNLRPPRDTPGHPEGGALAGEAT